MYEIYDDCLMDAISMNVYWNRYQVCIYKKGEIVSDPLRYLAKLHLLPEQLNRLIHF